MLTFLPNLIFNPVHFDFIDHEKHVSKVGSSAWPYDSMGQTMLCCGDRPVHWSKLSSILGLYPLDVGSALPQI